MEPPRTPATAGKLRAQSGCREGLNHEGHEGHEDGGDKKAIADFGLTSASSVEPRILNRQARPPRRVNCERGAAVGRDN
jgi:hypothetical protein